MNREFELLDALFDELFPLLRSITGPGIEASIDILSKHMPLEMEKVASGTKVFDWEVPVEWHLRSARLTGPGGELICDASHFNLHVLNYSEPVDQHLELEELMPHLYSLPALPDAVPYVTSYYKRNWGFCITQHQKDQLASGTYHAQIDSEFVDGGVPFAHCVLEGESEKEILLTSYLCHPSLANNELSGPLVLLALWNRIKSWKKRRFSYRFLLNPETIGSLCFLFRHGQQLRERLVSGLVLTCVGGPSPHLHYKQSRLGHALIDEVVSYEDKTTALPITIRPFTPVNGSDERQFCSPGFNLPMGQISRSTYGQYEGYHNSRDDKAFMGIQSLVDSAETIEQLLRYVEVSGKPVNLAPFGEPQLGKRDLYPNINSKETRMNSSDRSVDGRVELNRRLILLNMADGTKTLKEIATACDCTVDDLLPTVELMEDKGLIAYNQAFPSL